MIRPLSSSSSPSPLQRKEGGESQSRSTSTAARGVRILGKRAREGEAAEAAKVDRRPFIDVVQAREDAHAPSIFLPSSTSTTSLDHDTSLLAHLLHPIPVHSFLQSQWQRRPLAVLGVGGGRVAQLIEEEMFGLDVRELMANSASDSIFVWVKERAEAKASTAEERACAMRSPIRSFPLDNPAQLDAALACYGSGASLYFRSSPSLSRLFVRALNAAVGFGQWGINGDRSEKGEIEVFCSRAGHLTGFHTDFQHNFTVQLQGKKTWLFGPQLTQHPVRGYTPHYADQSTVETQKKTLPYADELQLQSPSTYDSVTLSAGDVLYHPAGVWHAVHCDEDSVSINVSLIATTYADLLSDAVRQLTWDTPEGRMPVNFALQGEMQLSSLWERLVRTMEHMRPDQLVPRPLRGPPLPAVMRISRADALQSPRVQRFRGSPLWRCFSHFDPHEEAEEEEGEGAVEEGEEGEGAKDEMEEKKGEREKGGKAGGRGAEGESVDEVTVVCHYVFGNESCESAVRVRLCVPSVYEGVIGAVVQLVSENSSVLDTHTASEVRQNARLCWKCEVDEDGVQRVLQKLVEIGYISVLT